MKLIKKHPLLTAIVLVIVGLAAFALINGLTMIDARIQHSLYASAAASAVLAIGCLGASRVARRRQREKERPTRRWFGYLLFGLFFLILAACLVVLAARVLMP